ncbi:aspartate/glutamate racemase family protein [Sinomonas halotolerans]|uniref:Aspartate/glutamate racemase family protein n=1 Tax=Sinomonas halotolerans TaxID=1644133 RepID=A0ABU9X259_9MICC
MRVALIRALTTSDPRLRHAQAHALEQAYGLTVVSRAIADQPTGVHDGCTLARAAPKVLALAREMEAGVDAVLISCTADPGLAEARKALGVPVVGAGSAGAASARALGGTVGVLGVEGTIPAAVLDGLAGHPSLTATVQGVTDPSGFHSPSGALEAAEEARRLRDAGADVILLASAALTSIGLADHLRAALGVPVVDPVVAAGAALVAAVAARGSAAA